MEKYLRNNGRVFERFDFTKRIDASTYERIPCFYCDFFSPFTAGGCPNAEQCKQDKKERGNDVIYKVVNYFEKNIDWSRTDIKEFVYIGLNF